MRVAGVVLLYLFAGLILAKWLGDDQRYEWRSWWRYALALVAAVAVVGAVTWLLSGSAET